MTLGKERTGRDVCPVFYSALRMLLETADLFDLLEQPCGVGFAAR